MDLPPVYARRHHHRPPPGVKRPDATKQAERCALPLHPDHAEALASPLPDTADNSKLPPTDQGQSSSCTAHSLIKGVEIVAGFVGSEHVLYSMSGALEESPIADNGRQCVDCLTVVSTMGVAPFAGPSPDGRNSDIWTPTDAMSPPPNVNLPATPAETTAAASNKFALGSNSLDPAAANLSDLLASCLAAKGVVYLGTQVGQAFEQLQGQTVAQPDPANDPNAGGHALIIVGYRTMPDKTRQFKVQNSWGESWDEAGECWASLAWCAACWELHPLLPVCSITTPAPATGLVAT